MTTEKINEQIEEVMKNSLVEFSKELKIPLNKFRIKMRFDNSGEPICIAMNENIDLQELHWRKILGLMLFCFKGTITDFIKQKLNSFSEENNIEKESINIKFFAIKMDGTPNARFCNNNKTISEIDIKNFL